MSGEVRYLTLEHLLHTAHRTIGHVEIRDIGLLESAAMRPRTTVFGEDAYPSVLEKAAALVHSLAKNHALIDGNKRLSLAALLGFLGVNGLRLTLSNDDAYDFIIAITTDELDGVAAIAARLGRATEPFSW